MRSIPLASRIDGNPTLVRLGMYYAFYARHWNGPVELSGLESRDYQVVDDVDHKDFGVVHGPRARIRMEFDKYILLEAR
jgi:alpha-galactosidase